MDSNIVETITGKSDFGEFEINIHEFHGVFWISTPEFDDDGYFTSIDDAMEFAKVRYEPFICLFRPNGSTNPEQMAPVYWSLWG